MPVLMHQFEGNLGWLNPKSELAIVQHCVNQHLNLHGSSTAQIGNVNNVGSGVAPYIRDGPVELQRCTQSICFEVMRPVVGLCPKQKKCCFCFLSRFAQFCGQNTCILHAAFNVQNSMQLWGQLSVSWQRCLNKSKQKMAFDLAAS